MRIALLLFLLCSICACQKEITVGCNLNPKIVLEPEGYTTAEWDTIYIKLYEQGMPVGGGTDTFIAKNLEDVLVVYVAPNYTYDIAITIAATNHTHWVSNISVEDATVTQNSNEPRQDCYRTVRFSIAEHSYHYAQNGIAKAVLKK